MSSTYTYPTIKTVAATTRAKGDSDTATLQAMFPTSPGNVSESPTAADYKEAALALLLHGQVSENLQVGPVFDRDYGSGLPDLDPNKPPSYGDVKTGGGGLPASAWVPNPKSPGEGSVDPLAIEPLGIAGYGTVATNGAHAAGSTPVTAAERNPSASSAKASTAGESRVPRALGKSPYTP